MSSKGDEWAASSMPSHDGEQALSSYDVEHVPVHDDPRAWSQARKTLTLAIVSLASLIAGLATTCQNPANAQIEQDLRASGSDISWSMSLFVLVQGTFPTMWSAVSEIKGRKIVYLSAMSLFIVGSAVSATSNTISVFIGMRVLQAVGSGALIPIAAATLADIYDPHERGTKMGMYYAAPLLGNSIGPVLGGIFTQVFGWRAVFWCGVVVGCVVLLSLVFFFKDTYRKERSLSYLNLLRKRSHMSGTPTVALSVAKIEESFAADPQKAPLENITGMLHARTNPSTPDIKLSFTDVNPFPSIRQVLGQWNNNAILVVSGLVFGFAYTLAYTCARTLSTLYGYDALATGLILLSMGLGSIFGSALGGRVSDQTSKELKMKHGGKWEPEMRLQSTFLVMPLLPLSTIGYAWICQTHQHVAAICFMLFVAAFSVLWIYTSALAYLVDANKGRSSTAVAANSSCRGIFAFIAAETALPLQERLGDGGMYTLWAGLLIFMEVLIVLVFKYGKQWSKRGTEAGSKNDLVAVIGNPSRT